VRIALEVHENVEHFVAVFLADGVRESTQQRRVRTHEKRAAMRHAHRSLAEATRRAGRSFFLRAIAVSRSSRAASARSVSRPSAVMA
jgi:hypothetical protein